MPRQDDETLDRLTVGGLKILQAKKGYRFSIDPVLLCGFIGDLSGKSVVDLGTGNGIIPLLLSAREEAKSIVGVEVQPAMVDRSRRTMLLNGLQQSIRIVQGDIRDLPSATINAEGFDVVTTNPPYRSPDTGRTSNVGERSAARHELAGGLEGFLKTACLLLKDDGSFYVIYLAERLPELLAEMRRFSLEPKRVRFVHSRRHDIAKLVLVEGQKKGNAGIVVEPPLIIYEGEGRDYSSEVMAMYGMAEGDSSI